MMMTLNKMVQWFRYHVRAFLGTDVLPTRLELIAFRKSIEKNHRQVLEILSKSKSQAEIDYKVKSFMAPTLDWENVQRLELANMQKEVLKEG